MDNKECEIIFANGEEESHEKIKGYYEIDFSKYPIPLSIRNIPQIHWHKKSNTVFNEFHRIYKSYISKQIAT